MLKGETAMTRRRLKLTTVGPLMIGLALALVFGGMLVASTQVGNTIIQQSLTDNGRAMLSVSARLLFNPLYNLDVRTLRGMVDKFLGETNIVYVAVRDTTGQIIAEATEGWVPEEQTSRDLALQSLAQRNVVQREIGDHLVLYGPIGVGSEQIGTLEIAFDQAPLQASLGSVQRTMSSVILAFLIGAVVMVAVLARYATAPLRALTAVAGEIGRGNLDSPVPIRGTDESAVLGIALEHMRTELRGLYLGLERRVAERTADLRERTAELEQLTRNLEDAVDQSRRRALRLEASAQVAHTVTSVLEPDKLLSEVVGLIADRVGFYHIGIFMLDEIGRYAVLRAANSAGGQRMLARGHRLRVGEQGIVGYVTGTGRPRIALDVGADAVHFVNPDLPHTRSEMALPLAVRGRVIGALDVQSEEAAAFDDEDVAVLGTLADQIAVALDNARLFEESQASLRDMQAVQAQYTRQAWRAFSTQQEARTIEYTRSGVAPLGDQLLPELVLGPVEVVDRVSRVGEAIVTSGGGDGQTPASLVVPLELYGQPIGVLGFQETEPGRVWTEDEIVLAEAAAYEIAQVLESARLFRDTQQRAWREQAVGQITAQIRASAGVEDILQTAAEELGRALGVSRAIVRLDVRGTSLNPEAPAGQ